MNDLTVYYYCCHLTQEEKKRKCKKGKEEYQEKNLHATTGDRCSNSNIMNNGLSQHKKIPAGIYILNYSLNLKIFSCHMATK